MGQQPNIELEIADLPRPRPAPDPARRWKPSRPGELHSPEEVPWGGAFGTTGPDTGFVYRLIAEKDGEPSVELEDAFTLLAGDIGPLRLVVLDETPIDPWVRAKLMQVVEIYGNLIRLMDSRERDALTGLLNRQTFATLFELAAERNAGSEEQMALAVLDIDHFKKVNDTFGHLYGDEVLIHFARLMERTFRYTDDLFRFGGEEFLVLLSNAGQQGARTALERFRRMIEAYAFPGVGNITVSIGFVDCASGVLPTTLVDRADQALYFAKDNGRNQVVDFADIAADDDDEGGAVQLF